MCIKIDKKYKITNSDLQKYSQEQLDNTFKKYHNLKKEYINNLYEKYIDKKREMIDGLFRQYLVAETEDGQLMPNNVFRRLLQESESQTASLRTLKDDLSESIENAMNSMIENNNAKIQELLEDKLVPILEDLKKMKEESGAELIKKAIDELSISMRTMITELSKSITEGTEGEMKELMKKLVEVSASLSKIPNTITDAMSGVTKVIKDLEIVVAGHIDTSKKEFDNAKDVYQGTIKDIQTRMEILTQTQKENIEYISSLAKQVKKLLEDNTNLNNQFNQTLNSATDVAKTIEKISVQFSNNSDRLHNTTEHLDSGITMLNSSVNEYIKGSKDLFDNQYKAIENTEKLVKDYANEFTAIKEGLQGIFIGVREGLEDYQNTTATSLNKYLGEFATVLSKATDGLNASVSNLTDTNEELTDAMDKLLKKVK